MNNADRQIDHCSRPFDNDQVDIIRGDNPFEYDSGERMKLFRAIEGGMIIINSLCQAYECRPEKELEIYSSEIASPNKLEYTQVVRFLHEVSPSAKLPIEGQVQELIASLSETDRQEFDKQFKERLIALFFYYVQESNLEMIKLLEGLGLPSDMQDANGDTPRDIAQEVFDKARDTFSHTSDRYSSKRNLSDSIRSNIKKIFSLL